MSVQEEITAAAGYYRSVLERSWTTATRHANYNKIEGVPLSSGQCMVATCVVLPILQREFPTERLGIGSGRVLRARLAAPALSRAIESHAWIDWQRESFSSVGVIDLVPDQADDEKMCMWPTVVASHDELEGEGIVYRAHRLYNGVDDYLAFCDLRSDEPGELRSRVKLLEANFLRQLIEW